MVIIERSIEVNVPVSLAYRELSQFEEFPRFMKGVHSVHQLDAAHLHWRAERGGKEMEWDAEITEHIPEQRIAWRNTNGPRSEGRVLFEALEPEKTRICLSMETDEESMDKPGGQNAYLPHDEGDLARFKKMIESKVRADGQRETTVSPGEAPLNKIGRARAGALAAAPQAWVPTVDLVQDAGQIYISVDLPGVSKQDVHIEVARGQLTIEGDRRRTYGAELEEQVLGECKYGRIFRAITLPAGVDSQSGVARMQDGVLEVTFKIASAPDLARRLEIQEE
ncbi:SRPBCC family protein [Janthinobacterium sp. 17J80-10]|uniref:SRPBCC family protein n=1 Tax=Janthinobacterium sp. 17J80-10 TaxID=2497863 RepID=UPI0013E8B01F|nr:SRPBCC family protein [Janthinobacterium sp. 17J80-10]